MLGIYYLIGVKDETDDSIECIYISSDFSENKQAKKKMVLLFATGFYVYINLN